MTNLQQVLTLFKEAGLTVKLKELNSFSDMIDYLGHVIIIVRLEVAEHTSDAILCLQYPMNITELKSFLRLCNVFRGFVPNFSLIAVPLNSNLMNDQPGNFDPLRVEERAAMLCFQERLISSLVLAFQR